MRGRPRVVIMMAVAAAVVAAGIVTARFTFADTATSYSIWNSSAVPKTVADPDNQAVELGMKLKSMEDGLVTAVRFYKSATNTGVHTGSLWTITGQKLAGVTFEKETASGWQQASFAPPVPIKSHTMYVISYHTDAGHYADDTEYFSHGRKRGPLRVPADGSIGPNGVYTYGKSAFPATGYRASAYYVDLVFVPSRVKLPVQPPKPPTAEPTATVKPTAGPTAAPSPTQPAPPPPQPVPPVAGACPAFPAMPDANCTGWQHTGVKLHDCPSTVTTANVTLDGCRFAGGLSVQARNVTITRSRIEGLVEATYLTNWSLGNLRLVDVEVDGGGKVDQFGRAAIGNNDYSCVRCHIHGTGRGANLGGNVTIQDSYLHDWVYVSGAHQTAIGSNGGRGFRIIHNNLICNSGGPGCSAALSFYGDFAPVTDVLVQNNLFNTNGAYCTFAGSTTAKPFPRGTQIRYIDNLFGKKYNKGCGLYGPVATWEYYEGNVWSGNRWEDGSGTVLPKSGT
jgi:hypothetical protein